MGGEVLRKRREESGFTIPQVAEQLRIRPEFLAAIEGDEFGRLPVAVYTKGYIRCYAEYLHVDPEPIIRYFSDSLTSPQSSVLVPIVSPSRRTWKATLIASSVILMILFAAVLAVWHWSQSRYSLPPASSLSGSPPSPPAPPLVHDQMPQEAKETAPPVNPPENGPQPAAVDGKTHSLEVTAHERSWLQITFEDGRSEEAMLQAGAQKSWKFDRTARLRIGNAGGVSVMLDGKDMGPQGDRGEVLTLSLPME